MVIPYSWCIRRRQVLCRKGEIENVILSSESDVIIIDPEREYSQLVKALGGEVIHISATSQNHINAMDMTKEYGDGANPVILKSDVYYVPVRAAHRWQQPRRKTRNPLSTAAPPACTAPISRITIRAKVPTLQDFRAELLKQDEPEAQEIALPSSCLPTAA